MSLPEFLHDIIQDEIVHIQKELLRKVAKKYHMNEEQLFKDILEPLNVVSNNDVKVDIIRRKVPRVSIPDSERCVARIWNRGKGGQCTRRGSLNTLNTTSELKLCTHHFKEYDANQKLRHGTIDSAPPKDIFSTNVMRKSVYK
jgi:hypothetical protein